MLYVFSLIHLLTIGRFYLIRGVKTKVFRTKIIEETSKVCSKINGTYQFFGHNSLILNIFSKTFFFMKKSAICIGLRTCFFMTLPKQWFWTAWTKMPLKNKIMQPIPFWYRFSVFGGPLLELLLLWFYAMIIFLKSVNLGGDLISENVAKV